MPFLLAPAPSWFPKKKHAEDRPSRKTSWPERRKQHWRGAGDPRTTNWVKQKLLEGNKPMTDPWERYIHLRENDKKQPNVGEYTSPMDPYGNNFKKNG